MYLPIYKHNTCEHFKTFRELYTEGDFSLADVSPTIQATSVMSPVTSMTPIQNTEQFSSSYFSCQNSGKPVSTTVNRGLIQLWFTNEGSSYLSQIVLINLPTPLSTTTIVFNDGKSIKQPKGYDINKAKNWGLVIDSSSNYSDTSPIQILNNGAPIVSQKINISDILKYSIVFPTLNISHPLSSSMWLLENSREIATSNNPDSSNNMSRFTVGNSVPILTLNQATPPFSLAINFDKNSANPITTPSPSQKNPFMYGKILILY
jgi:hypothetical protein